MKEKLYKIIDAGGISKLDPGEFRGLYIKKIYNDQGMNKNNKQLSFQNSFNNASTMFKSSIALSDRTGSPTERNKLGDTEIIVMKQGIEEKLGVDLFTITETLKKKILTLYQHLQYEHHPIRKIILFFQSCIE